MPSAVGRAAAREPLDEGQIHDVLRNDRRRLTIETLQADEGHSTVRELSEVIAAHESGEDPPPRNVRQSVYVSLHQTHLPMLAELGIVSYDADSKVVSLQDRVQEVAIYMEVVPPYGISWGEFYFGLALLGLSLAVAVTVGVPRLADYPFGTIAICIFALQLLAAAYHVYTQQDLTVLGRLLR